MITKYYVDPYGKYLGGFVGAEPPAGAIEVPVPPVRGDDIWDGEAFCPAPQAAPQEVTMRQARLALLSIGKLDQVAPAIEALEGAEREAARIEWEFSSAVMRNRPLVIMLGQALGLDEEALDQLFITAAGL